MAKRHSIFKEKHPTKVIIASIMAPVQKREWQKLVETFNKSPCDAFELNFSCPNGVPEKASARKTLEGLVDKGYPEAQLLYGELLANESNAKRAYHIFAKLESNPYATESYSDEASRLKTECNRTLSKKPLRKLLSENSEQPKKPSFVEIANSAKDHNGR